MTNIPQINSFSFTFCPRFALSAASFTLYGVLWVSQNVNKLCCEHTFRLIGVSIGY